MTSRGMSAPVLPSEERDIGGTMSHDLNRLLDFLEKHGASRGGVAHWEWMWLPPVADEDTKRRALQLELSEDSRFFVELLKWVIGRAESASGS